MYVIMLYMVMVQPYCTWSWYMYKIMHAVQSHVMIMLYMYGHAVIMLYMVLLHA